MKFELIVADPAWAFGDKLERMKKKTKRSATSQYDVMSVAEISKLPVQSVANPKSCVLALWTPSSMLADGLHVMQAWGFTFKQVFVWVKLKKDFAKEPDPNKMTRVMMGHMFRQSHELALIGTLGKVNSNVANRSQRSVAFDLSPSHSTKPPSLQDRLELMFPHANKLELFARRQRPGWICLGNAIDGQLLQSSIDSVSQASSPLTQLPEFGGPDEAIKLVHIEHDISNELDEVSLEDK